MINKITNNDLSAAKDAKIAVIDFSAVWCGPCKMLAPIFDALSDEYNGKVEFYNADVDENNAAAAEFQVRHIPNVVLLKDGKFVDRQIGLVSKDVLKSWIDEYAE